MTYVLTCQCCGHTEDLGTAQVAFEALWDEPVHMPTWPVTCPLCPGTASLDPPLVDHSEAHERWEREGRPVKFTAEGIRPASGDALRQLLTSEDFRRKLDALVADKLNALKKASDERKDP